MNDEPDYPVKKARGFAAMDPDKQREIARLGGQRVSGEKRYYSANSKAASDAGKKGAATRIANYWARVKAAKENDNGGA